MSSYPVNNLRGRYLKIACPAGHVVSRVPSGITLAVRGNVRVTTACDVKTAIVYRVRVEKGNY